MKRQGGGTGRFEAGFTLTEMLLVMLLIGITLTLAVPSFSGLLARNALSARMNDLVGAMQLARSEAVLRNTRVTLCRRHSNGTNTCDTSGGWQNGWLVFVDDTNVGVVDSGETIIANGAASPGFTYIDVIGALNRVSFRADGTPTGLPGAAGPKAITICKGTQYEGKITLEPTGRPITSGGPDYPIIDC